MKNQWWKSENKITYGVHKCSIFDEIMTNVPHAQILYDYKSEGTIPRIEKFECKIFEDSLIVHLQSD